MLPFLFHVIALPDTDVQRVIEIGALSYTILGLACEDEALRAVALRILSVADALLQVQAK